MINISCCDDDDLFLNKITEYIHHYAQTSKIFLNMKTYSKSTMLIDDLEDCHYYDIYIIDIEIPNCNGLELAHTIRKKQPDAIIIFLTGYVKYAVDSFELSVFRYISKQSMETRLGLALTDAVNLLKLQDESCYLVLNSQKYRKIFFKDILYIYKNKKYSIFVLKNEEIPLRKSLYKIYEDLDHEDFKFIDRCYIINLAQLVGLSANNILLNNGQTLWISTSHIGTLKDMINVYWGKQI